jgi:hypothetical protein
LKKIAFIAVATLFSILQNNNEAVSTSDVDTLTVVVDTLLPPPAPMLDTTEVLPEGDITDPIK